MKTNYFKAGMWLFIALFAALNTNAQTTDSNKNVSGNGRYFNYDRIRNEQGKKVETMEGDWDNKTYKATLVDDKLTELFVDGKKIPSASWNKYEDVIAGIKEQIAKNREQAKKNREQARLNEIQAGKNQEQARLNEIQEKKNEEQAARNQEQDRLNEIQAKKNDEQAQRNQEQAQLNKIQEEKNQQQAVRNQEQARLNEIQAKKNEEQAKENERFIKEITADLVADKIIPDGNSLKELTFNNDEMTVNGVKQSSETHQKYAKKYGGFIKNGFNFSDDGIIRGN
ncbi:MAG TPA: hypothetical protein VFE53_16355 [Mucilaginibacter sp.]|jgi:chromosome segregation ATPase|nr:hypothetical protein [Mucilaginibacter sp.]